MKLLKHLAILIGLTFTCASHAGDLQELRKYYKSCLNFAGPLLSEWVEKDPDLIVKIIGHQILEPGFIPQTSKQRMFVALAQLADTEVTASDRVKLRKVGFQCEFDPKKLKSQGLRSLVYRGLANSEMLQSKLNDSSSRLTYREAGGPEMGDVEEFLSSLSRSDQKILMEWGQTIMADSQNLLVFIQLLLNNYDMDL